MGIHHLPVATSRYATCALDAALVLRPLEGNAPSTMLKREQLLGQLEPPL